MSEIKTWANTVGQQIEDMTVDLVATTAANVSEALGDVFFVGRPAQNDQDWILKKITPTELNKMVYNYLTSNAISPLLAAVLGATAQQTEPVDQGSSVDITLPYGSTWVFRDTVGQTCALINIAYNGCILVAATPGWSAESETESTNHVIKVEKMSFNGTIRITRNGASACRYRYKQLIG